MVLSGISFEKNQNRAMLKIECAIQFRWPNAKICRFLYQSESSLFDQHCLYRKF